MLIQISYDLQFDEPAPVVMVVLSGAYGSF